MYHCPNCKQSDYRCFQYDNGQHGDHSWICTECGTVNSDLDATILGTMQMAQNPGALAQYRKQYKATYLRRVHLNGMGLYFTVKPYLTLVKSGSGLTRGLNLGQEIWTCLSIITKYTWQRISATATWSETAELRRRKSKNYSDL